MSPNSTLCCNSCISLTDCSSFEVFIHVIFTRSQLCMGMNQVTRSLEKDAARLVLLDEHCRPPMLTAHLVELAEVRKCPIVSFPHLSECAKKLFGLSCLVALAFKVCNNTLVR